MTPFESIIDSTIRTATPLLLASLGELLVERVGIVNIGLEGMIIAGAFASLVGATHVSALSGFLMAVAVGAVCGALFWWLVDWCQADQIVTGTAVTLLALGLTGALYRMLYGASGAALSAATVPSTAVRGLAGVRFVGVAFNQPAPTYLGYLLVPLLWWWLYRTYAGLSVRAIGESPDAARVSGVPVDRYRLGALICGGALAGLAGATLVLAQVGTFAEGMSAGRGFIAIAIVALGRWHPLGVLAASLLFGVASALQHLFQATGSHLPYQLFLALPYVLALGALGLGAGRAVAPAFLGRRLDLSS